MSGSVDPGALDYLATTPLHIILAALHARLKLVFPAKSGFSHNFLPPRFGVETWRTLTHRTPFVGIGWVGLEADSQEGAQFIATSAWSVILATRNANGPLARFAGDRLGAGLFSMISAATVALQGYQVSQDGWFAAGTASIRSVSPDVHEAFADEAMAVAQISVEVRYEADEVPGLDDTLGTDIGLLDTLGATWAFAGDPAADFADPFSVPQQVQP